MTAFGLTGAGGLHFAPEEENAATLHEAENARRERGASRTGTIGTVEEGSLEEEIWRELGALPRSRRTDLRS
jgi:hypothetical protein